MLQSLRNRISYSHDTLESARVGTVAPPVFQPVSPRWSITPACVIQLTLDIWIDRTTTNDITRKYPAADQRYKASGGICSNENLPETREPPKPSNSRVRCATSVCVKKKNVKTSSRREEMDVWVQVGYEQSPWDCLYEVTHMVIDRDAATDQADHMPLQ